MDVRIEIGQINISHIMDDEQMAGIHDKLDAIKANTEKSMALDQEARDLLTQMDTRTTEIGEFITKVVAEEQAEDAAAAETVSGLNAQIKALEEKIAAGEAVNAADLAELKTALADRNTKLQAAADALKALGGDPENPVPDTPLPDPTEPTPAEPTEPVQ